MLLAASELRGSEERGGVNSSHWIMVLTRTREKHAFAIVSCDMIVVVLCQRNKRLRKEEIPPSYHSAMPDPGGFRES